MTQAPDSYVPSSIKPKYRFARVNLVTGETTYEERLFLCRRDFLEALSTSNRVGLRAAPHWAYYEAPAP
jgi:hypothetical protein